MNAFEEALEVEERGKRILAPWLMEHSFAGRWGWIAKGQMSLVLQKIAGDAFVATEEFASDTLEFKFLASSRDAPFEVWSNRVESEPGRVNQELSTRGWGLTYDDRLLIAIYNIAGDIGVIGRMGDWRAMLKRLDPRLEVRPWDIYQRNIQGKRSQMNATEVLWTPYADLVQSAGFQRFSVKQFDLLDRSNPISGVTEFRALKRQEGEGK